jgi:hypothetical protein
MSFNGMLKHRGQPYRLVETQVNGYSAMSWVALAESVPCFLDLNFLRPGKDPAWTPEAGRPSKRSGVLFVKSSAGLVPGDRVKMLRGPSGVFQVNGAVDEAWRPTSHHHSELSVEEVAQSTLGQTNPPAPPTPPVGP